MRRRFVVLFTALALALVTAIPSGAAPAEPPEFSSTAPVERGTYNSYIVVMKADPLVVTEGRENLDTPGARNRGQQMRASHDKALRDSGVTTTKKVNDYVYALNGFSALITHEEAVKLAANPEVALVIPDELQQTQTDSSPGFIGLTGPAAPWTTGVTGKGVVVGIIDTGIWPEHPSFADNGLPAPPTGPLPCEFGNTAHNPDDAPFTCNNKLIGARQVMPTYRAVIGADPDEFDSARDDNGHGTHTASTAAGNGGVAASVLGNSLGTISGIAPDAHVIAYKGLGNLGGFGSDLAAAIDQAVADGVDVINYSVGGGSTSITADEIAFLFAADAGVDVATSAGNSGPGAATIRNPAKVPWLTTVGANTQTRFFAGTVELGNGATYEGASVTQGAGPAPLVDAADAGGDLCIPGSLDPDMVDGAIVLCRRGQIARVAKSLAVMQAGGVGMVMYENDDVGNLFTDTHWVPTVHVDNTPGLAIKAYIADAGEDATAEIRDTATKTIWPSAPSMTVFSSRGPNVFPDLLKPDVTAPGMQILAAYSPFDDAGFVQGELFGAIAGTSMSSPHVAGLFALIKQVNPGWSAAAARSALMTTAHQDVVDNDRVSPAGVFAQGAGHVRPGKAVSKGSSFQPGLVYDAGLLEYFGFLCDAFPSVFANPTATCGFLDSIEVPTTAENLNYPSIAVSDVPGSVTVTRTVTSVAKEGGNRTYRPVIEAPPGFSVTVSPSSFTLKKGESRTYEVTITNESAPAGAWREGSLTWRDRTGSYSVRSPIVVRAAAVVAPDEVVGTGTNGDGSFDVVFGYNGPYTALAHGLVADAPLGGAVDDDPGQDFSGCATPAGPGETPHLLNLSGTAHLRITMEQSDVAGDPGTDIDLFLCRGSTLVASSGSPATDEIIDVALPVDDTYTLWVHGWSVPDGNVGYTIHMWNVPLATGGSLVIDESPVVATSGATGTIEFSWTGAPAGTALGAVSHNDPGGVVGLTLIRIEN